MKFTKSYCVKSVIITADHSTSTDETRYRVTERFSHDVVGISPCEQCSLLDTFQKQLKLICVYIFLISSSSVFFYMLFCLSIWNAFGLYHTSDVAARSAQFNIYRKYPGEG